jgi:hypothetical protein
MFRVSLIVIIAIALASSACGRSAPPKSEQVLEWQPVGTWGGDGNIQTESFTSNTGVFRFTWESRDLGATPGHVQITLHSAVSGRPLIEAVDHVGPGSGIIEVNEDPREFYVVISAKAAHWNLKVEEGISLILTPTKR